MSQAPYVPRCTPLQALQSLGMAAQQQKAVCRVLHFLAGPLVQALRGTLPDSKARLAVLMCRGCQSTSSSCWRS